MKQWNINPNEPQTWTVQTVIQADVPDELIRYAYENLQRQASEEFYSLLNHMKSPVVVEVSENLPDISNIRKMRFYTYSEFDPTVEMTISVRMTPVLYRHVTMAKYDPVEYIAETGQTPPTPCCPRAGPFCPRSQVRLDCLLY